MIMHSPIQVKRALAGSLLWTAFLIGSASAQYVPPAVTVPGAEQPPGVWPYRVTAGLFNTQPVANSILGGTNSDHLYASFPAGGPIKMTSSRFNEGDFALLLGPNDPNANVSIPQPADNYIATTGASTHAWRINRAAGLPWATVRVNGRNNSDWYDSGQTVPVGTIYGAANFSSGYSQGWGYNMLDGTYVNGGNGASDLLVGIGDTTSSGGHMAEASLDVGVSFFPYGQGWIGGMVNTNGGFPAWQTDLGRRAASLKLDPFAPPVTWVTAGSGNATVNLGAGRDPAHGMLFVAPIDDDSVLKIAAAAPNTENGWNVTLRELHDRDTTGNTLAPASDGKSDFAFLYIDYTKTDNLVGGRVSAAGAKVAGQSAGNFTVSRTATGTYTIDIPGKTGNDGVLILSNADGSAAPGAFADRSFLSYQYNSGTGKFIVQARETTAGAAPLNAGFPLADTSFYVAWVDFTNPLSPAGEDFHWTAFFGNFSVFDSWSPAGRPAFPDNVFVDNGGTATIDSATAGSDAALAKNLSIGTTAGSGALEASGGELFIANRLLVGDSGTGTFNHNGGRVVIEKQGEEDLHVGNLAGGAGVYHFSGGELTVGDDVIVGNQGKGTLNLDGGTVLKAGYTVLGNDAGSVGELNMTAGQFDQTFGDLEVGDDGSGTANFSGGTFNVADRLAIGNRTGTGTVNISDGAAVNAKNISVGRGKDAPGGATGTLTMTGGTLTVGNGEFNVGVHAGSSGTVNLNGGTLGVNFVAGGAGESTLNFDGGTLQARQSSAAFLQGIGEANVRAGGAIIDTQSFNATVAQDLRHEAALGTAPDGGLTKLGGGTLTLSGANTYTGGTVIAAGTLLVANAGALPAGGILSISAGGTAVLASGLNAEAQNAAQNTAAVPEPGTILLLAAGLVVGLLTRLRRHQGWPPA